GVAGVGLVPVTLGDDRDGPVLRRVEGEGEAGDPAPDDEEVGGGGHGPTGAGSLTRRASAVMGVPAEADTPGAEATGAEGARTVKILVPLKRVADPDNANKVKIPASGEKIETAGLEWKPNPFDEYALEAALRLTEDGKAPKVRAGEVVVVTFGPKETEQTL